MRVEIGKNAIMEKIYALSALQGYVELPERERALLQEDQEEGLMVLVGEAFAEVVMEMMPRVANIGMPGETPNGDMWIELKEDYEIGGAAVTIMTSMLIEAIGSMVLGAIYDEHSAGDRYARRAKGGIASAIEIIDNCSGRIPRIQGWR